MHADPLENPKRPQRFAIVRAQGAEPNGHQIFLHPLSPVATRPSFDKGRSGGNILYFGHLRSWHGTAAPRFLGPLEPSKQKARRKTTASGARTAARSVPVDPSRWHRDARRGSPRVVPQEARQERDPHGPDVDLPPVILAVLVDLRRHVPENHSIQWTTITGE